MSVVDEFFGIGKRDVSTKEREKLAGENKALPDGSFPIASMSDLMNAITAWGRTTPDKREQVRSHIMRRAKALGASQEVLERIKNLGKGTTSKSEKSDAELFEALNLSDDESLDSLLGSLVDWADANGVDFKKLDEEIEKARRKRGPNPKSTPKEIVGSHGHRPHGPSILWPALYEHLRRKGMSKSKAARISNAAWKKKRMGIPLNTPTSVRGAVK